MQVLSQSVQALQAPACLKQAHDNILLRSESAHKWVAQAASEARQVDLKMAQNLLVASLQLEKCAKVRTFFTQCLQLTQPHRIACVLKCECPLCFRRH